MADIRGNYKYKFVLDEEGTCHIQKYTNSKDNVIMLIKKSASSPTLCMDIDLKTPCTITAPTQYLYGHMEGGKSIVDMTAITIQSGAYQMVRQPLKLRKQWDVYNISKYCENLDNTAKNYLYPKPSEPEPAKKLPKDKNTPNTLKEDLEIDFAWMRNEITTREWDLFEKTMLQQ